MIYTPTSKAATKGGHASRVIKKGVLKGLIRRQNTAVGGRRGVRGGQPVFEMMAGCDGIYSENSSRAGRQRQAPTGRSCVAIGVPPVLTLLHF